MYIYQRTSKVSAYRCLLIQNQLQAASQRSVLIVAAILAAHSFSYYGEKGHYESLPHSYYGEKGHYESLPHTDNGTHHRCEWNICMHVLQ